MRRRNPMYEMLKKKSYQQQILYVNEGKSSFSRFFQEKKSQAIAEVFCKII